MKTAAFFDVDGTLVNCQTHMIMYRIMRRQKVFSLNQTGMLFFWYLRYSLGLITDSSEVRKKVYKAFSQFPKEKIDSMFEQSCDIILKSHIRWKMKEFVDKHKQAGDMIFGISASLANLCHPVCKVLEIPHCFSTTLCLQDGCYTGAWEGLIYEGQNKRDLAEQLAKQYQLDLSRSAFYTDSFSDFPLLEIVGHPVAVCPSPKLRQYAKSKNWLIIND